MGHIICLQTAIIHSVSICWLKGGMERGGLRDRHEKRWEV